jgi:hypothetical protein
MLDSPDDPSRRISSVPNQSSEPIDASFPHLQNSLLQIRVEQAIDTYFPPPELVKELRWILSNDDTRKSPLAKILIHSWLERESGLISMYEAGARVPNLDSILNIDDRFAEAIEPYLFRNDRVRLTECAHKHLFWLAHEGLGTLEHVNLARHAISILRTVGPSTDPTESATNNHMRTYSILVPQLVEHYDDPYPSIPLLLDRLRLIHELFALDLPWGNIPIEALGLQIFDLADRTIRIAGDYDDENQIFLSAHGENSLGTYSRLQSLTPADWAPSIDYSADDLSEVDRHFLIDTSRHLHRGTLRVLVERASNMESEFWERLIEETPLNCPYWIQGMVGLERCYKPAYDQKLKSLVSASAHSPYGARSLIALALYQRLHPESFEEEITSQVRAIRQTLNTEITNMANFQIWITLSNYIELVHEVFRTPVDTAFLFDRVEDLEDALIG